MNALRRALGLSNLPMLMAKRPAERNAETETRLGRIDLTTIRRPHRSKPILFMVRLT